MLFVLAWSIGGVGLLLSYVAFKVVAPRYKGHWHYRTLAGLSIACLMVAAAICLFWLERLNAS